MTKTYIYFHVCTIENWEQIATKLFTILKTSGLLDLCDELRLFILGTELEKATTIFQHSKTKIVFHSLDVSLYERPCLLHIRSTANNEKFNVFYFHTKGVRAKNANYRHNISDWIDMMCYFLVEGHLRCIQLLHKSPGAVGVNCMRANGRLLLEHNSRHTVHCSWHFSGNFWWANSEYIKTLPESIDSGYLEPELWIGAGNGVLHSLHRSGCDHYFEPYPSKRYVNDNYYRQVPVSKAKLVHKQRAVPRAVFRTPRRTIKRAPKAVPKAAPTAAPKAAPKAVPKAVPTAVPTAVSKATPKTAPTAVSKATPKTAPTAVPKAVPKATPKAAPNVATTMIPAPVKKIYIYFHICTLGNWKEVITKLYQRILTTNLIEIVEKINVVVLGCKLKQVMEILKHPKVQLIYSSPKTTAYERPCLELLYKHALREDCRFLYIHSKGITKQKYPGVKDWIELMIYFNINEYEQCLKGLETFDTVGVNIYNVPTRYLYTTSIKDPQMTFHYSGNFWWANSKYIRSLPAKIGAKYIDPELWIGCTRKKRMLSLWQSGVDHYRTMYPFGKYLGRAQHYIHQQN